MLSSQQKIEILLKHLQIQEIEIPTKDKNELLQIWENNSDGDKLIIPVKTKYI